jgi:tetratricopeptide (TPR) repeat protein
MKRGSIFILITALVVIFGLTTSLLHAQAGHGKGRLKGKVVYAETKEPAVGASVMMQFAMDETLKHETRTNAKGEWAFLGLGTGEWKIIASIEGYMPDKKILKVSQFQKNPYLILKLEKPTKKVLDEDATLIGQGNKLFEEGKFAEALEAFKGFKEKSPEFYETHINIGNCLMNLGKYDEAIASYNKFLEEAKIKNEKVELQAQCLASIGEIYVKQENMEKAREFFVKSIDLNPKNEILAYNVAEIFFGNNKNEEALKYYQKASLIKPDWSIPHLKMGYVYLNLGDMQKAVESFTKFVEMDPSHPETPNIKEVIKGLKEM